MQTTTETKSVELERVPDIESLRLELLEAFHWVKKDPKRALQVKEMSNAAGKIINTLRTQLEYAALRKEVPDIAFLNTRPTQPQQPQIGQ